MKRFRVYGEEDSVYFKLKEDRDGSISLVAVDENGKKLPLGYILRISPDGKLSRYMEVNENIGLQLDIKGRIVLDEDD